MTDKQVLTRKTRFVCVSDTHNASPGGAFKLPHGNILLHAGDLTNQGSFSELQKTLRWIEESDFETKIVVAGNHDITLDTDFYAQYGLYFHNQDLQDSIRCRDLLERSPSILWLNHESAVVRLASPTGPHTTFKIFGSPFSPAKGMWAFGYGSDEASQIWDRIPLDSDIVITHTPPKYHCDETRERRAAGCEALRQALWRVRPRLAICGHVHEGRGAERICWDLSSSNIKYKESRLERWNDPGLGNKKMSLVDLTVRSGNAIENDGSAYVATGDVNVGMPSSLSVPTLSPECLPLATLGQGGSPPSQRCDLEALSGRLGRKETCVVNCAIMASSWPHGSGGKRFNKPIVVDIDLPVWEESED